MGGHRLLIKTAILMPEAKKDEVTIVEIESEGYNKKQVILPICAMKGGADVQKYIDLLVPSFPAKLKIIQGAGPLHLVGSHCVDYYGGKDDEEDDEDDDEEMEEDVPEKDAAEAAEKGKDEEDGKKKESDA